MPFLLTWFHGNAILNARNQSNGGETRVISCIASCIVDSLIRNKVIDVQNTSLYQYGFEIFISSVITVLITVVSGIIFHCLAAAIVYFILFVVLRSICGGYHAKTYWQCNLTFAIVTTVVLLIFQLMTLELFSGLHICSIIFSILVTVYYAPIENENKRLSVKQKKIFRILSTAIVFILVIASCVLKIKFASNYSILIDTTLFAVTFSMFVTEPMKEVKKKK